ncbi:serine/threonine protein kinase [Floridanema aerugineum]|uniref:Serine/threonine protein kinase n=1 Tax=Floridaenema aerugineum BLCC-F46 TaxID=3153654 RepID=A0ABV4XHB8_9CYAN
MSNFPDFSHYGYQIKSQLGNNSTGGRFTYLAHNIKTQESVVIKQFQFAQLGATWSEYQAYQEEIKVLQSLHHPQIPRYLQSFQTPDGFCMVQEYKNAQSLAIIRSWTPQQIKEIAISALKILVYLQRHPTPIIHRDIKPENILIDEQMNVYLVDFGFARMGGGEVTVSSVVKGTLGFMPPEQLFNREITKASDLYGLGATLICLLTGTKSVNIGSLIDANYYIRFRHLVPPLQRGWMNWLEKMVEPNFKNRFANAAEALKALKTSDIAALPKVRISHDKLEFTATKWGEKLTQTITISNPIPETLLASNWSVAPHKSDPPHTPYEHAWISFNPARFESNNIECEITVDTSQLLTNETYSRQILLHTNSDPEYYSLPVQLQTAPLPEALKPNYLLLLLIGLIFGCLGYLLSFERIIFIPVLIPTFLLLDKIMIATAEGAKVNISGISRAYFISQLISFSLLLTLGVAFDITFIFGSLIAALVAFFCIDEGKFPSIKIVLITIFMMIVFGLLWDAHDHPIGAATVLVSFIYSFLLTLAFVFIKVLVFPLIRYVADAHIKRGFHQKEAAQIALLTVGICVGMSFILSFVYLSILSNEWRYFLENYLFIFVISMTILTLSLTLPLVNLLIYQPLKRGRFIANYRRSYSHLIKP